MGNQINTEHIVSMIVNNGSWTGKNVFAITLVIFRNSGDVTWCSCLLVLESTIFRGVGEGGQGGQLPPHF